MSRELCGWCGRSIWKAAHPQCPAPYLHHAITRWTVVAPGVGEAKQ